MRSNPERKPLRHLTRKLLVGTVVYYGVFFALHALWIVRLDDMGVLLLTTGLQSVLFLYGGRALTERAAWAYERGRGYYTPEIDPYIKKPDAAD